MHEKFLQQAVNLACDSVSRHNGGPYGAIIVKNGEVISASRNQVTINKDPTAHAEIIAIRLACKVLNDFKLTDCTLYSSCEPCPMCFGAIYWAKLEKVFFACNRFDAAKAGFDDSFIYKEMQLQPETRHIVMSHISLLDAQKPFIAWNAQKDKTSY
jgi:guanine deaminase